MSEGKTPKLSEVIEAMVEAALARSRTTLIGRVLSYNADSHRATVQVQVPDIIIDERGERVVDQQAPLTDVPVALLGSGTGRIKWPVRRGDEVLLLFSSSAIAQYKATGRIVDPGTDRHHHLADAVAIPVVITGDFDGTLIEFTDAGTVEIGGSEPLVTRAEFLSHGHASAAPGPVSPPILHPAPLPGVDPTFPGTDKLRG